MTREDAINVLIKSDPLTIETNKISDGFHTFGELYDHRIELFIALCRSVNPKHHVWKSKQHFDGSEYANWFIMGIGTRKGEQVTYHLPMTRWEECWFAQELVRAPEWDGHTSADVLQRLKEL